MRCSWIFLVITAAVQVLGGRMELRNILDNVYSLHLSYLNCLVLVDTRAEFIWFPPLSKNPKVSVPVISVRMNSSDARALSQGPLSPEAVAAILSAEHPEEWSPPPPSTSTPALRALLLARRASCDAYTIFLSDTTDPGFSLLKDGPRSGILHGTAKLLVVLDKGDSSALSKVLPPTHSLTRVAMIQRMEEGPGYEVMRRLPEGSWVRWTSGEILFGSNTVPQDLGGRPLVLSTFPYPPFSFVKKEHEEEALSETGELEKDWEYPLSSLEGTEVRIVREMAKRLNFEPRAILRPTSRWINLSPNGSLQGVLGDVSNLVADIGLAGFYQDAREGQMVDYSATYTYAAVTFLVPRPRTPSIPRWMAIFSPFTVITWVAVAGTLAAAALTLRIIASIATFLFPAPVPAAYARYIRLPDCILHVASVVAQVGVPISTAHQGRWPLQWLLPGLNLITYCYSGCLVAYLTLPTPETPINTLSELREAGLPWGARTAYWSLLLLHNWENEDAQVLGRRFRLISDPMALRQGLLSADLAVAVQTVQGSYVTNAEYLDARAFSQVHLMEEVAFEGYVSLLFPKGSPLTTFADSIINRLIAGGLIQRWERDLTSSSSSHSATSSSGLTLPQASSSSSSSSSSRNPIVLSLEHLLGAFLMLLIGLLTASIAFTIEFFAYKRKSNSELTPGAT